jgi:cyclic-di-AMP phosphodiesterase PgpH
VFPTSGKKKKEQEDAANKKSFIFAGSSSSVSLLLLIYALPQTSFRQVSSYTVGEPWRADDLTAPVYVCPSKK